VRQLRSAGGLLTGMVNMDAYAYGFTTENSHYGATRNPHDLTRIAGGRPAVRPPRWPPGWCISLGTDTNGSIRVPASLCGIYGLKPTFGRLSRSGSHPFVASLDHIGPFARRVCDLASVYDALQGRDTSDGFQAESSREQTRPLLDRGLDGLRCAVLGGYFTTWCDADARTPWRGWRRRSTCRMSCSSLTPSWRAPRRLSSAPPKGKSVPARASPGARAF
jgi:aspartyl-tRNA(Asn)/glutamyl-tRNA(Gln) amidotransferase subunit A